MNSIVLHLKKTEAALIIILNLKTNYLVSIQVILTKAGPFNYKFLEGNVISLKPKQSIETKVTGFLGGGGALTIQNFENLKEIM